MSIFDFFRSLLKFFFTKKNDDDYLHSHYESDDDIETFYLNNPIYEV
jgi:hypothetical protein